MGRDPVYSPIEAPLSLRQGTETTRQNNAASIDIIIICMMGNVRTMRLASFPSASRVFDSDIRGSTSR